MSFTPKALAAAETDLVQVITEQYDAYAKSIYQSNAADDTMDVMFKHSLYGKGKTLPLSEKDPVAGALYESNLFRTFLIQTLTVGARVMQKDRLDDGVFGTDSVGWHEFYMTYMVNRFHPDETLDPRDDVVLNRYIPLTYYEGPANDCDKAMMVVVGGCSFRVRMRLLERDFANASYRVEVVAWDEFNFDGDYSAADKAGYDTSFSKLLSALGPLLGLKEYTWSCTTGFDITVPLVYDCNHDCGDYRWDHNGTDFVASQNEGLTVVPANRVDYTTSLGTSFHYYELEAPITLLHTVPWALEFRQKGNAGFMLGPDTAWTTGNPYFLRTTGHMHVGYYDPDPDRKGRHQYGFDILSMGYSSKDWHTFRIENRISQDGSNMLWLFIDGQELGPMNHYYYNPDSANTDMETTENWASGVDFTVAYIGGTGFPIRGEFEYVAIWQDGPGNTHDPFTRGTIDPTCVKPGYTTKTCKYCGYTEATEAAPPLGHREKTLPGTAATCTAPGLTDGILCETCGETLKAQEPVAPLGHKESPVPAIAPTCTESGFSEGSQCETCGELLKQQTVVDALGHRELRIPAAAPTCTETGLTEGIRCETCGETLKAQETVDALTHQYEKAHCIHCGQQDPDFRIGDVNDDGKADYSDALYILRASIGLETLTEEQKRLADVNGDGKQDYSDALQILRASIGL